LTQENVEKDRDLLRDFLPMTKKAVAKLREMEANNRAILGLKRMQVQEARGEKEKEISDELSTKVRENQSSQKYVKETLETMRLEVANARKDFPDEPECRVIVGIYSALMVRFREVLREFQESQLEYKNATQEKIRRQIAIVKPEADEEEIQELVNDPDATSRLLNEQITGTAHAKIRNAVDDIDRKYRDILKLEKGVEEVYQLFLDLGTLIEAQGEMLDSILTNMHEARDYIKKGIKNLDSAKQIHKKTRTKM
jgi:syntaxin 1B/2/3